MAATLTVNRQLREKLVQLLVDFTGRKSLAAVRDDAALPGCGLDSLGLFRFLLELEKQFALVITEHDFNLARLHTFGNLLAAVAAGLQSRGPGGLP